MTLGNMLPTAACPLWVKSGLMQRSKNKRYSITSSARARRRNGVKPNVFDHLPFQ
jgi:hypothetical protein